MSNRTSKIKIAFNRKSHKSIVMTPIEMEFEKLGEALKECKKGGKHEAYFIRGGEMEITEGDPNSKNPELRVDHYHRNDKSLLSADLLILDADSSISDPLSAPSPELMHNTLVDMEINHIIYTTHSHKFNGKGNRYRVVIPCRMSKKSQLIGTIDKILDEITSAGVDIEGVKEGKSWSQPWFFPTRDDPDDGLFEFYEYYDGSEYESVDRDAYVDCYESDGYESGDNGHSNKSGRTMSDIIEVIKTCGDGMHHAINDFLYGQIKDGVKKSVAVTILKSIMDNVDKELKDKRFYDRYREIDRSADGAERKVKEELKKKGEISSSDISDISAVCGNKELKGIIESSKVIDMPVIPGDCMENWPEPWPEIWKSWKTFSVDPIESLLIPTILSFHAFFLNGKYRNERGRRPNMFFLCLAESTGNKDVNSKDVLYGIEERLMEDGIFNTIFTDIANIEGNISSDTAFLKMLEGKNGRVLWINTEATRVFHQLNSAGGGKGNSAVMALGDKMIEVVDGMRITGKVKADGELATVKDPNVQILFYAQPETIESHVNVEMIDSGFIGRSIIWIDGEKQGRQSIFGGIDRKMGHSDGWRNMSKDLMLFYTKGNVNALKGTELTCLKDENLKLANDFYFDVLEPIMEKYEGEEIDKVIKRMGVAVEQLYSIVLGVCREWDDFMGREEREAVSLKPLLPLCEYWAKCKEYMVMRIIESNNDIVVDEIMKLMAKIILEGKVPKKVKAYAEKEHYVKKGFVPRAIIPQMLRKKKSIKMHINGFATKISATALINQAINNMIQSGIIDEVKIRDGKKGAGIKMLYFP